MNIRFLKILTGVTGFAIAPLILVSKPVDAQPNNQPYGMSGSYLGVTVDPSNAFGLSQDYLQQTGSPAKWFIDQALQGSQSTPDATDTSQAGASSSRGFQGRIDLNHVPFSIRGKVTLNEDANVVQPIISYDLAIARNANIYAGAGYSFVNSKNKTQAPEDQNAFFVTAGAEAAISDKVVVYGDAQYPLDQGNFNITAPVKVQVGIGFRF
ncbi:hypothetical protein [Leptothermofonsia sp. ETS-13]|uniref:hypothetical protein n=1 Tax=Leptothermofonsia sp. ETS-13 TaxID=3035696 RepID=UPI003B9E34ED